MNKMFYFALLDGPFRRERQQDRTYDVEHNMLDDPLPFKIIYANIVPPTHYMCGKGLPTWLCYT